MTGIVIDIATRREVAQLPDPAGDRAVVDKINAELAEVLERGIPTLSASSADRPHFERGLRALKRHAAIRRALR